MPLELIEKRCSIRNFSEKMPEDEKIANVLEAARLAPSWMNTQPWHFIVIKNQVTKELLSKLANGQPHITKAPVIIACCGDLDTWESDNYKKIIESKPGMTQERANKLLSNPALNPDLLGKNAVELRTIEQLTYAIAYMTIETENQGLGCCIIGAVGNELTKANPDIYSVIKEELNLPENMYLINLLLVGYPEEGSTKPTKSRKFKEQIVSYESLGQR